MFLSSLRFFSFSTVLHCVKSGGCQAFTNDTVHVDDDDCPTIATSRFRPWSLSLSSFLALFCSYSTHDMTSARRQRTTCRRPGRYRHRRRTAVVVVVFVVVAAVVLPSPRAVALASLWFLPLLSSVFAVVAAVINYMSIFSLACMLALTLGLTTCLAQGL